MNTKEEIYKQIKQEMLGNVEKSRPIILAGLKEHPEDIVFEDVFNALLMATEQLDKDAVVGQLTILLIEHVKEKDHFAV